MNEMCNVAKCLDKLKLEDPRAYKEIKNMVKYTTKLNDLKKETIYGRN